MRPQAVKGTYDILPERAPAWRWLRETVGRVLERAGVAEIEPPVFEHSEVFVKAAGASSDLVVQKEMYTFEDRGGRSLTLRPEFTAGVLRAYIEHGMHVRPVPVKLWSMGPAFRAENVQRGRFRQFRQVNLELLGLDDPLADAEAISLMHEALRALGLRGLTVRLGTVGDPDDRERYNAYLRDALGARAAELSETSRERLRLNPMRVFDSKDAGDQALVADLDRPLDFLGDDARAHFEAVQAHLTDWGVPFEVDPSIVRGLDYYRRTAFEIHHGSIGAQSALGGGGRYDGLVEAMGGPTTPGIGWAFGTERVLDALEQDGVALPTAPAPDLYLVPLDEDAVGEAARLARTLRTDAVVLHGYAPRRAGKGLREASRSGARWAGIRGSQERQAGRWLLKELASGEQREVAETEIAALLAGAAARTGEARR